MSPRRKECKWIQQDSVVIAVGVIGLVSFPTRISSAPSTFAHEGVDHSVELRLGCCLAYVVSFSVVV